MIDVTRLRPPLGVVPDDPTKGGTPGHVSIVPVDAAGAVDQAKLDEWATARGQSPPHSLTQMIIDAVAQTDIRQHP
jgi:hypothetical protein